MENGQKSLMGLFNGDKIFIVPKYQRAFAWEEKHINDFVDDIYNHNDKSNYFFGTVLFMENDTVDEYEQIEIVDGQQRITTLIIFMSVLLNKVQNDLGQKKSKILTKRFIKDEFYHKLQVQDIDNEFFKTYIIGKEKPSPASFYSPSQKKLWRAKKLIIKRLEEIGNKTSKDIFIKFIKKIENTNVLTYSVKNSGEATLIFETTNDRGKNLTNLEKTKSYLMYKTYLSLEKPEDKLNTIHDRFRIIFQILDKIDDRLAEDSILQYHFISYGKWSTKTDYQKYIERMKSYINKISSKEIINEYIDNYSYELRETFSRMHTFLEDKSRFVRDIILLGRLGNFYPLINKILKYKDGNEIEYYRIIRLIEIYSFRVYGISRKRSDTGQSMLFRLSNEFVGDFDRLNQCIKDEILYYSSNLDFKDGIEYSNFYSRISNFDKNYLFWKYENFLRTEYQPKVSEMSEDEFSNKNPKLKLTIEHITAQKGLNGLKYPNINSDEFQEKYMQSIGNLTIDPHSSNSSKGKEIWKNKNEKYFQKAPYKTQLELSDFVNDDIKEWNEKTIMKRAFKIFDFATKYWNPENI